MKLNLNDRVALILASSKGLGKSVAYGLGQEGARIVICGREEKTLFATAEEIKNETASEVYPIICDLSKKLDRKNLVDLAMNKWGRIDILVTNTGGPPTGQFEEFDLNDWEQVFNHLFLSATDIIKRVLPSMKKNGYGRILTITSMAVKQPIETLITSNAIRTGLVGFVKSLSNEVASSGITVNNIMPGWTMTDRLKQLISDNPDFEKAIDSIPMKRFGTVEEFASAAIFLVSDQASYITGVSLPVDGGWIKGI
ncbi:MAG: SDR family oxidoreductase [Candidatus Neomarinimicrobiota bacterium]